MQSQLLTIATRDLSLAGTNTEARSRPSGAHGSAAVEVRAVAEVAQEASGAACDRPSSAAPVSTAPERAGSILQGGWG